MGKYKNKETSSAYVQFKAVMSQLSIYKTCGSFSRALS